MIRRPPRSTLDRSSAASDVYKRQILCPVDQSSTSARGLRNAVRLAKIFGSEILVLSVVPEVSWLTAAVETGELADVKAEYALSLIHISEPTRPY